MADHIQPARSLRQQFPKEYNTWKAMRNRCSNESNASWKYYGGKGITVCDRWLTSFANFMDDMGAAPSADCQIERMNNAKGYAPENCHWATPAEQQANTSKVRPLTCRGVTLPIWDWARLFDIAASTIRARIRILGWDAEKAILTPCEKKFSSTSRRGLPPRRPVKKRNDSGQSTRNDSAGLFDDQQ